MSTHDPGDPMPPSRRRDPYIQVGEALRTLVATAATRSLRAREYRVLLGILHYTVSYSKLADEISLAQLVAVTGVDRRNVQRALTELHERGVIVYQPGASDPGKPRKRSRVTLPNPDDRRSMEPPVEKDGPAVQQATGQDGRPEAPPTAGTGGPADPGSPSERPAVQQAHDRRSTEPRTGGPPSHPSEKYPRRPPEAHARTREAEPPHDTTTARGGDNIDNFLDPIPDRITKHITPDQRDHLARLVDTAIADRGWRPRQLGKAVLALDAKRGPLDELESMGAVAITLERRLTSVGSPPRARHDSGPPCATCNGPGWLIDLDDVARPCPTCNSGAPVDTSPRIDRPTPDPIAALLEERTRG